ncbi:hypothetical protein F511_11724 [Dorcoceras hygrometricum]|uniref:Uncharacterized protein n=1 Tax=Dorcoceras hygrometricum TaxID=472368 RepID=A0A2Z7A5E5_9LAMI|nr:hypothetical protein F511_11724 [Dorcoceras hygrometricum]
MYKSDLDDDKFKKMNFVKASVIHDEQIATSVPATGDGAINAQDVAPTDDSNHQLVSTPASDTQAINENHQLVSEEAIQPDIQAA